MAQWYCVVNGQRYGPIDELGLRDWIGQGRLTAKDLVWTTGMTNWVAAETVEGLFTPSASGPPPLPNSMVSPAPSQGTGGQTPNARITARARNLLKGNWGLPIAFCLLLGILSAGGGVPLVGPIVSVVLAGPFAVGSAVFFLTFVRGGKPDMGMLFVGFRNFGNALGTYVLIGIFVFLWSLLLIIPGIIAALAYSQVFYLLADDRTLDPMAAIRNSKALMQGHKAKLFCLQLRFLGWALLCILTLGIGLLWLIPYMTTSLACFHEDIKPPATAEKIKEHQPFYQWQPQQ